MQASHPLRLAIGKLGEYALQPGYYLYAGSALGGLESRLARHCRPDKRLYWHIDYLTTELQIREAWIVLRKERLECVCAQALRSLPDAEVPIAGFGSSDCRCATHLVYCASAPSAQVFEQTMMGIGGWGLGTGGRPPNP